MSYARIVGLTSLAMIAFAGNSLLCRVALKHTSIDAASFTTIRLISGAVMLWLVARMSRGTQTGRGNWLSAFALFVLCGRLFFCVCKPARGNGCTAALWRCPGNDDRPWHLGGRTSAETAARRSCARSRRTGWSVAARSFCAAPVRVRIDVERWGCMGRLFFARERCGRSHQGNSGEFPARCSYRGSIEHIDA